MTLDDHMVLVDQDRVMETELRDDLGERVDRALVDARVVLIGLQLAQFEVHNLHDFLLLLPRRELHRYSGICAARRLVSSR